MAAFRERRTLEDFDWQFNSTIKKKQMFELATCQFVRQARDVLVIDEVGYLAHRADAANVLFQVVDHRYLHKKPMLFTTNKPLTQWGQVLHDPDLAEAITDRVLERGRFIPLRGASYRTRHLKDAEKDGDSPCA